MERVELNVQTREGTGKSTAKKLRKKGEIPAVVYTKGKPSLHIITNNRQFVKLLHQKGVNVIIDLKVKTETNPQERTVLIKEIQNDPLKGDILHIDFQQIKLTERIKVHVPLVTKGECPGVKEGGILEYILRELEIECLPTEIPKELFVDISALKIGEAIHVKDLSVPKDLKVITQPELIAVIVKMPVEEVPVEEKPVEAEVTEPEVIKQKKPEQEEETEGKEKSKG